MNIRIQTGKGVTGALRYVQSEGRDPKTGTLIELAPGAPGRAELIGGTGFGFEVTDAARADLARRMMEFAAQNQASKTRKCVQDCVHIELSWARGETPGRKEMMDAARGALAAQGMGNAMAVVYSHKDEDYAHVHIVASKINPDTGYAYNLLGSWRKGSAWAEQWERDHGGVINTRRETANELRRAIKDRDVEGVLTAITKQRSTFIQKELQRAVNKEIYPRTGADGGARRTVELERAQFINAVLAHPEIVQLRDGMEAGPTTRYTTRTVLEAEIYVLDAAAGLKADNGHGAGDDTRTTILAGKYSAMTAEQAQAFRHCTGDEGLALIDGQAGTGKSFTLAAIRDAYEAARHRVIGLAPTNRVAKNLGNDGFAYARTVHSELFALNNGRAGWDAKTVVMVDEAAMLDTKLMAMLTAHAHDAGAKLILAGDDRQLSSIDRGGMFGVLKDRHGAAVLSEVKRQHKADDRRASEMMAEGNFHDALGIHEQKGAITWTLTQKEARAALVEKWTQDTAADRDKSRLVLAYTNEDADRLNLDLRAVRKERGELEWEDHAIKTAHGRFDFSAGDHIRFTGTDKQLGIINNTTGTIEAIDGDKLAVRLDGPGRKTVEFDAGSFGHFRHGYAGTIYAAQGSNLDQVYLYHSEHWRSAPAYVALTRHKDKTELFVARNTARDLKDLAQQVSRSTETRAALQFYQQQPIGPVRPRTAPEILAHFAGEHVAQSAGRMQREARRWPQRHYNPRPRPPWPALRERRAPDRDDTTRPRAVNENMRARMARRARQREGTRPMDELWDEERRRRRGGGTMDMDLRPREPRGQQQPPDRSDETIVGTAQADEIRPEIITRLMPSEPERGVQPDTPDRDRAEHRRDSEVAARANEILARENNSQATYDIGSWEGGYAVFRTWNREDELVAQVGLPSSQQKLGAAPTLGELHAAIIDGSVFTAASEWVTDERIGQQAEAKPEQRAAANQNERELDPFTRRLREGFTSFQGSTPEPGRYQGLEPAPAEPLTAEAIARDPWNAVALELPADADPRLLFVVARTAQDIDSSLTDRAFGEVATEELALEYLDQAAQAQQRQKAVETLIRGLSPDTPLSKEAIDYDPWAAVYQPVPPDAGAALLRQAYGMAVQCAEAVAGPPGPAQHAFEPTILYGAEQSREENFERAVRRVDELDARLQAVRQDQREFSLESIRDDPWSAVDLEIPANADQELLKEAHATVVQCCQAVSREPHPFDIYAPDNEQTPERNFETAARRLDELGGRLQAGLEPGERASLAEDILDRQDGLHSHYDIAPWQDGFAVFRIHEIEDGMPEEYRPPTGQQVLGWAATPDRLHDAIIDGSALIAPPEWVTDRQMAEAEEQHVFQLAHAADDAWRAEASRQSSEEVPETRYDRDTGERLSGGGGEVLYDRDTGERLDSGGQDREAGHDRGGGGLTRMP